LNKVHNANQACAQSKKEIRYHKEH